MKCTGKYASGSTKILERKFAEIVPGVTKRRNRVLQRGDFFTIDGGTEGEYDLRGEEPGWQFGNFFELKVEYGYVLRARSD